MTKVRKKKPLGTPGGNFPPTQRNTPPSLSVIDDRKMNENDEEPKENDEKTSASRNGDYVYEEKFKIDMLVDKTKEPVHVRNQAIIALSRLFEGDMSRGLIPFYPIHQKSHQVLKTTDSLPHTQQEDLNVYLTNPILHINHKTKSQLSLTFFQENKISKKLNKTMEILTG